MIINYLENVLKFYSDWNSVNSLIAAAGLVLLLVLLEIIITVAIRRNLKPFEEKRKIILPPWALRIIRVFLRFLLIYLFIKLVQTSIVPEYPWNLVFYAPTLVILFSGILITLYKAISILEKKKFNDFPEDSLKKQLLVVSRRGLKTTLFLILLSLLLWRVLELFPAEVRASGIVTGLIIANGVILIIFLFLIVHQFFVSARGLYIHKTGRTTLKFFIDALSVPVRILIIALAAIWMKTLVPNAPGTLHILSQLISFLFLSSVIAFIYRASEFFGSRISRYSDEETNSLDKTLVEMMRMILRILIITASVFAAIRIFTGQPLTTLLAGLGIGGLAVALAAQDTLKNFFGSIMIMSDKPFKIGERVVAEGYDGVIEGIGFRSTRMRTLTGHQVIIPNDKMAISAIENIGRRPTIRRLTNITITYDTPPEKIEQALTIIKGILENHEGMLEDFPPRVYFSEFNPDSLNIQVIYWYSPPDYWQYMDFTERVNLQIMKEFNREGIKFAFPSTTTYLEQPEGQSLRLDMGREWKEK
jgi:MscS family membrane protein